MNAKRVLGGCRIVVTRPEEQATALAQALEERGAGVRVRPLVRITPPADSAPLQAALSERSAYHLVAFTSANAVRACTAIAPAEQGGWPPVACVGTATAECARERGLDVALVPTTFTAEALALELRSRGRAAGRRILWPRASGARATLAQLLTAAGAEVVAVEAYRTEPDPAAAEQLARELAAAPADVLVFTSPSAVHTYADAAGVPPCAVAVIGTVTRDTALRHHMDVVVVPEQHDRAGLVSALETWYSHGWR